ncbi:hypothetical protein D3C80_1207160 [compost metagenome]
MGKGVGYNGIAEGFAFERRVFAQHLFPPYGTQLRFAGRRRIAVQIFGTVSGQLILNDGKMHRDTVLGCDTDGSIVLLGVSRRLGRLAQNALFGKIDRFAKIGKHVVHMFIACLDIVIQLSSQWIHPFHPSGILLGYIR